MIKLILLHKLNYKINLSNFGRRNYNKTIKIGNVTKDLIEPKNPELVPLKFIENFEKNQLFIRHLQWMIQKDNLGQDIFLVGPPGAYKRRLALSFAELTKREIEYLTLSRDTTESDLKQRREIVGSSAIYLDQSALRAAVNGRILILDGIEKAERNVLPILNNLLENREMQLEDGRFLMRAQIYNNLMSKYSSSQMDNWKFIKCHEDFRVIALGLPVPKFRGNPLDPPLRSRFQARYVDGERFQDLVNEIKSTYSSIKEDRIHRILSFIYSLHNKDIAEDDSIPYFPLDNVKYAFYLLNMIPELTDRDVLDIIYPYRLISNSDTIKTIDNFIKKFNIDNNNSNLLYSIKSIEPDSVNLTVKGGSIFSLKENKSITLKSKPVSQEKVVCKLLLTDKLNGLLCDLVLSHSQGDYCLVGVQGSGKSSIIEELSHQLGGKIRHIVLYGDMTSRELLQQRETDVTTGDTIWRNSALVRAALDGDWAVLGGLHRLDKGCIAVLNELICDRQLQLFDGSRLIRHDRFDLLGQQLALSPQQLNERGIFKIHEDFRVIALSEMPLIPGESASSNSSGLAKRVDWLSAEVMSAFKFHQMPELTIAEQQQIVEHSVHGLDPNKLQMLLKATHKLMHSEDPQIRDLSQVLSIRQLLRISHRLTKYPNETISNSIKNACLSKFLPKLVQETLDQILSEFSERKTRNIKTVDEQLKQLIDYYNNNYHPSVSGNQQTGEDEAKIPNVLFYDSVEHSRILLEMLQDFSMGYDNSSGPQHLLLIGNQGVGKNKITDRFLQLLNRPREYIQLHRDTTVQTLTLQPTIKDGRMFYEDSPLVKAITKGSVLVVDEADKASTQVTCILKNLLILEDMELSDGRRIVAHDRDLSLWSDNQKSKIIRIHPQFRMIVLANRPGFPFLGNDFFGAMGDVFSSHSVDNPDINSEIEMLQKYGPEVPLEKIKKLVFLFSDLRNLADQGQIQYPYSTREIVNVVKHLQKYPNESLSTVLGNVFDFDLTNQEMLKQIELVLEKHGIALAGSKVSIALGIEQPLPPVQYKARWSLDTSNAATKMLLAKSSKYKFDPLDTLEAESIKLCTEFTRSRVFSELDECISLKVGEYNLVSDMITNVTVDQQSKSSRAFIHFATLNPIELTTIVLGCDINGKLNSLSSVQNAYRWDISHLFPPTQGMFKPQIGLVALSSNDSSDVLLHESCSNSIFRINTETGEIGKLFSSNGMPEKTFNRYSSNWPADTSIKKDFMNDNFSMYKQWSSLLPNSTNSYSPFVIFHRNGDDTLHYMDILNNHWHKLIFPFKISSVFLPHPYEWLIYDVKRKGYRVLSGLNSNEFILHSINVEDGPESVPKRIFGTSIESKTSIKMHENISKSLDSNSNIYLGSHHDNYCEFYPKFIDGSSESGVLSVIPRSETLTNKTVLTHSASNCTIEKHGLVINSVNQKCVPKQYRLQSPLANTNSAGGFLEVIDLHANTVKYLRVPSVFEEPTIIFRWLKFGLPDVLVSCIQMNNGDNFVITLDNTGCIQKWSLIQQQLLSELHNWKQEIGANNKDASRDLMIERLDGEVDTSLDAPKHGKVDPDNSPHVGGNTWAGGTGGRDTAGLGGIGGPYRLDAGHNVFQVSDSIKNQVPDHVKAAAREIGQKAWQDRLRQIKMSELDYELYMRYYKRVEPQISSIKVILDNLQAASKERQWLRHRTHGDLDDGKLVEGVLGEKTIYRARWDKEPEPGTPQQKPKRLRLLVDVSGSMYRFNGHDQRMERQMEAVLMLMEGFTHASPDKLIYEIYGHSGEGPSFPFVNYDNPPANEKERMEVIMKMLAHSQFCNSGDHTVEGLQKALTDLKKASDVKPVDQSLLVMLSDANLSRYGIPASSLQRIIVRHTDPPTLQAYLIFIGSLATQAMELQKALPPGRSFLCMQTEKLPNILQSIFQNSLLI